MHDSPSSRIPLPLVAPSTFLVGIGNKARHGKDTLGGMVGTILTSIGLRVYHASFARALYAHCRVVHGMGGKDAPLLQRVGVEMRGVDLDVWVRAALHDIIDARPDVAILTDVRFPNEAELVRDQGGLLVNVTRVEEGRVYVDPSRPADHPSEVALDSWDWDEYVVNDGPREALWEPACALAGEILLSRRLAGRMPGVV